MSAGGKLVKSWSSSVVLACRNCAWQHRRYHLTAADLESMHLARRHASETGHEVTAELRRSVVFGWPAGHAKDRSKS